MKFEEIPWASEIKNQPTWLKFLLAQLIAGLIAFYVPTLIVSLTGQWVNLLKDPRTVLVYLGIFTIQNGVGILIKHVKLMGIIFASIWFIFFLTAIVLTRRIQDAAVWWPVLFAPELGSVLNAYCLKALAVPLDMVFLRNR